MIFAHEILQHAALILPDVVHHNLMDISMFFFYMLFYFVDIDYLLLIVFVFVFVAIHHIYVDSVDPLDETKGHQFSFEN